MQASLTVVKKESNINHNNPIELLGNKRVEHILLVRNKISFIEERAGGVI